MSLLIIILFDIILKYIPSAVIGLFGFFISKGTSRKNDGSDQQQDDG